AVLEVLLLFQVGSHASDGVTRPRLDPNDVVPHLSEEAGRVDPGQVREIDDPGHQTSAPACPRDSISSSDRPSHSRSAGCVSAPNAAADPTGVSVLRLNANGAPVTGNR